MMQEYFGIGLDSSSRCYHYHTKLDIVALKCSVCQKYYACYKCHDALEEHCFAATKSDETFPVLCGSCRQMLTLKEYKTGFVLIVVCFLIQIVNATILFIFRRSNF